MENTFLLPKDGLTGLKENWKADVLSGFMVFLLALPLSLGIADQSKFPVVFGILTAIIGGMIVSIISGSRLTIKGPAAGLAPIVAGAVIAFNDDPSMGWKLTCGAIVVAALFQIAFGYLKLGSMSNFFPASAIHGMLAAIGILIFSKQIHNLLGIPAKALVDDQGKSLSPLGLLAHIPQSILHLDWQIALIGVISLAIIFGVPLIKNKFVKIIPIPVLVLVVAIPMAVYFNFGATDRGFALIKIGNFIDQLTDGFKGNNISFGGINQISVFVQYVILFSLIGSIESLLTVKAIDGLDPYHRKSDYNKDLVAVGFGNLFSGFLGGLPMISEVARSSANVANGAKTRWSNFFHGLILLLAVLSIIPLLELIPKAALAALLMGVAYRLAAPFHFKNAFQIGKEQLLVFVTTIVVTIVEDLLLGVMAGIALEFVINIYYSKNVKNTFNIKADLYKEDEYKYILAIHSPITFSNFSSLRNLVESVPKKSSIKLDLSGCNLIDHGSVEQLRHLEEEIHQEGGILIEYNKLHFATLGSHRLSGLRDKSLVGGVQKDRNSIHQEDRMELASEMDFDYIKNGKNEIRDLLSPFALYRKMKIVDSVVTGTISGYVFKLIDYSIERPHGLVLVENRSTCILLSTDLKIPDFSMEVEQDFNLLSEISSTLKDIDFEKHPNFSEYYLLRGENEPWIRSFFKPEMIEFFENNKDFLVEVKNGHVLIRINADSLSNHDIKVSLDYAKDLMAQFIKHSISKEKVFL
jgi:MFS superfamily sulfate permease-like transporter